MNYSKEVQDDLYEALKVIAKTLGGMPESRSVFSLKQLAEQTLTRADNKGTIPVVLPNGKQGWNQ